MSSDPSANLVDEESTHLFLCFCSFVMNLKGKKLSIQNVFIHVLSNEKLKNILKEILNIETDFELVKVFLNFDPTIAKSKYVTKFTNQQTKYLNGKIKK